MGDPGEVAGDPCEVAGDPCPLVFVSLRFFRKLLSRASKRV